ncbi:BREX-2 system phosphatase PglZ [Garicola koreensis]|uniref:BREX-2 system phosphatase PglZ n=1 Tax=Garicola koreensis TaxID=1262554 RepID=A0A7W5TSP9_9MICC|nr:hypothetical protein [Garicola koreensis]
MTVDASVRLPEATLPIVRQLLESASKKGRREGVLGIRASTMWSGATEFSHHGSDVIVAPCRSALAVREALQDRRSGLWLVILTDRDEADLGTGILTHFQGQTLRNPDPWAAVREQFAASVGVDRQLSSHPRARELATGFLAARGDKPWYPARAGFLTYDHAFASVAMRWFDLGRELPNPGIDDVLRWAIRADRSSRIRELRKQVGDALADAALDWLARRCGRAQPLVSTLLASDRLADLVPLGLASRAVLACPGGSEPWVLLRVQQLQVEEVTPAQVNTLVDAAEQVTRELLMSSNDESQRDVGRVLTRADALIAELRADAGVQDSSVLRRSLTARLGTLGDALHQATQFSTQNVAQVDAPLADRSQLDNVERALADVESHVLAHHRDERRVSRAKDGVRLTRWLAADLTSGEDTRSGSFADHMRRHRDDDAWVDRAYGDAWRGVGDEALSKGLETVLAAVRLRRDAHDRCFAKELAVAAQSRDALPDDVIPLEDVIARTVVPLAREPRPVLMIVADGMSAAVGSEILDDIEHRHDSWLECVPSGAERRSVGVSALPSLTEVSRCSLLSGTLATGQQNAERKGFSALMKAHGLTGGLFHKLSLETSGAGTELAPDVQTAIDDTEDTQVVACVLNTIDDALDRSDPGMDWTADAVSHLRPLLDRARRAGRTVVMTSDHGHVIERRDGHQKSVSATSSNRSRPASDGGGVTDDEIRVVGPRVLLHDGDAVLAVDERLRYGSLKAGYHGGAAPAEVVVPIHVLVTGEPPKGWDLATPQEPDWWRNPLASETTGPATLRRLVLPPSESPTLFDEVEPEPNPRVQDMAADVVRSPTYAAQRERASRISLSDEKITALLRSLIAAPGHRADPASAASALGVAKVQLAGALPMVQRLLNVEQYPVLDRAPDGETVVLDLELLKEQFGVGR